MGVCLSCILDLKGHHISGDRKAMLNGVEDKIKQWICRLVSCGMCNGDYWLLPSLNNHRKSNHYTHTTVLRPFFQDNPGEPVPEENFWTFPLWCKGRLTEADTLTIRLGATPSGLTIAHLHHPTIFFYGPVPFLPPKQQCHSTEGN